MADPLSSKRVVIVSRPNFESDRTARLLSSLLPVNARAVFSLQTRARTAKAEARGRWSEMATSVRIPFKVVSQLPMQAGPARAGRPS